jgi:beta-glucosidase
MVYSHYRTFAPERQDQRYWDEASTPLYPFGHGLSYADFAYSPVRMDPPVMPVGGSTTVSVDVTNTSDRDADEVAQLYVHQRYGTSSRPVRELKGFERVHLAAGESRTVTFSLGPGQLQYWSAVTRATVQDVTTVDVGVGGSSAVELTAVLEVTGRRRPG